MQKKTRFSRMTLLSAGQRAGLRLEMTQSFLRTSCDPSFDVKTFRRARSCRERDFQDETTNVLQRFHTNNNPASAQSSRCSNIKRLKGCLNPKHEETFISLIGSHSFNLITGFKGTKTEQETKTACLRNFFSTHFTQNLQ